MNLVNPYRFSPPISTSYSNPGGTGDRRSIITISQSSLNFPQSSTANLTFLINGNLTDQGNWMSNGAADGQWIRFDFGSGKIINEFKFYQSSAVAQGTWKVQGSNDNSAWTDIGPTFTLGGGTDPAVITAISSNATSYRYYRIIKVSGSTNAGPYTREFEFKISA